MAIAMAWVINDSLGLSYKFKILNRKPFNCKTCLSGWLTMILYFPHPAWIEIPFWMAIAMMFSYGINQLIDRL